MAEHGLGLGTYVALEGMLAPREPIKRLNTREAAGAAQPAIAFDEIRLVP